jgi:hypothetical protein
VISREQLRQASPQVETATTKYVKGEISRVEYEKQVQGEREQDRKPPAESSG